MKKLVTISNHAVDRLNEHAGINWDYKTAVGIIMAMYHNSSPFGIQRGDGELRMAFCKAAKKDLVLACNTVEGGRVIVKTVLSMDHAIANSLMYT